MIKNKKNFVIKVVSVMLILGVISGGVIYYLYYRSNNPKTYKEYQSGLVKKSCKRIDSVETCLQTDKTKISQNVNFSITATIKNGWIKDRYYYPGCEDDPDVYINGDSQSKGPKLQCSLEMKIPSYSEYVYPININSDQLKTGLNTINVYLGSYETGEIEVELEH